MCLDAAVHFARQQQAKQFVAEEIGVLGDPAGFLPSLLDVEVLTVESSGTAISGSDAAS